MKIITDIILLIALITGTICTIIVVIDCHKNNKLIQEEYKKRK
jgi:cell division protein FtsL